MVQQEMAGASFFLYDTVTHDSTCDVKANTCECVGLMALPSGSHKTSRTAFFARLSAGKKKVSPLGTNPVPLVLDLRIAHDFPLHRFIIKNNS